MKETLAFCLGMFIVSVFLVFTVGYNLSIDDKKFILFVEAAAIIYYILITA